MKKTLVFLFAFMFMFVANTKILKEEKLSQIRQFTKEFNQLSNEEREIVYFYMAKFGVYRHNIDLGIGEDVLGAYSTGDSVVVSNKLFKDNLDEFDGSSKIILRAIKNRVFEDMKKNSSYASDIDQDDLPFEFLVFLHELGHSATMTSGNNYDYLIQRMKLNIIHKNYSRKKYEEFIAYNTGDVDNYTYDIMFTSTFYRFSLTWETMADRFAFKSLYENIEFYRNLISQTKKATHKDAMKARVKNAKISMDIKNELYFSKGVEYAK